MSRRRPTPDEMALFERVLGDAKRLRPEAPAAESPPVEPPPIEPPSAEPPSAAEAPQATGRAVPPLPEPVRKPPPVEPVGLHDHARGLAPGVDRRLQLRFKRGQLPIEGRIDLHGLGREQARDALNGFLARSEAMGRRCVLVITGKGRPDWQRRDWSAEAPESGVIRRALPGWLGDGANRRRVLMFVPARPKDGGAGAWYVLLRRKRHV